MSALEDIAAATQRDCWLISAARSKRVTAGGDKVQALLDAVGVLQSLHPAHALIGGVAVGVHSGVPRATLDTDLAIHSSAQAQRLIDEFSKAGFQLTGRFEHSINFRHPSGEPVQIAFDQRFDSMLERAERFEVQGKQVPIVQKADLIQMKEWAASDPKRRRSKALRDLADVALLKGDAPGPDEGW